MSIYIAIAILLHVPYVQQQLGQTVANAVGKKIGTKVTVGRVDLGMLNRIIIDDVTILDQKGKTMMLSARIAAKIDVAALAKGRIVVNSAQLFRFKICSFHVDNSYYFRSFNTYTKTGLHRNSAYKN